MRRALLIAAICAAALAASAPMVSAFPLDGCTMSVQAMRADGTIHDKASGPGAGGTQDDPLEVDSNGSVPWSGTTGGKIIKNNSWHIDVFYLPLFRGSSANAAGDTSAEGTVDFQKDAPFRFTGLYFASGGISGDGGACDGSGLLIAVDRHDQPRERREHVRPDAPIARRSISLRPRRRLRPRGQLAEPEQHVLAARQPVEPAALVERGKRRERGGRKGGA